MKRVLIIEDSKISSMFLEELIDKKKYEVITCFEPLKAVEKIIDKSPDLVLIDILMPKKTGFEILKDIKTLDIKTKLIVTSSLPKEYSQKKAESLGAIYFIEKPYNFMYMKQIIENELDYIS